MTNQPFLKIKLISHATWIEFFRRKDPFIIVIFMLIYLFMMIAARIVGIESDESVRFLLNLGLTIGIYLTSILVIFISARQIPDEIENKTIYTLFAKPLKHVEFIISKIIAISAISILVLLIFIILTFIFIPMLSGLSPVLLIQVIFFQMISVIMLSTIGIFLSLVMPKAVSIVLIILLYFGRKILTIIIGTIFGTGTAASAMNWVLSYIPDFSILNLTQRFTDCAAPLDTSNTLLIIAYSFLIIYTMVVLSSYYFKKRSL